MQCGEYASDPRLMLRLFPGSFKDSAFTWFANLPSGSVSVTDWYSFSDLFCEKFRGSRKVVTIEDLRRCRQKRDQTLSDYFEEFRNISQKIAEPLQDYVVIDTFVQGVARKYQKDVSLSNPKKWTCKD